MGLWRLAAAVVATRLPAGLRMAAATRFGRGAGGAVGDGLVGRPGLVAVGQHAGLRALGVADALELLGELLAALGAVVMQLPALMLLVFWGERLVGVGLGEQGRRCGVFATRLGARAVGCKPCFIAAFERVAHGGRVGPELVGVDAVALLELAADPVGGLLGLRVGVFPGVGGLPGLGDPLGTGTR